eukprot:symbB.v1.2.017203.t1/scaffold1336.1/size124716/1
MGPSLTLQVEICPKAWRGHMVNVNNFFFTLGEIYAAWLLWAFLKDLKQSSEEENWRYVTALAVSPALLILPFAVLLLYESPHYLVTKGRHEQVGQTDSNGLRCFDQAFRGHFQQLLVKEMERQSFLRPNNDLDVMPIMSDSGLEEHSVFANAPRVARSMALLAKKRQARKSQDMTRLGHLEAACDVAPMLEI